MNLFDQKMSGKKFTGFKFKVNFQVDIWNWFFLLISKYRQLFSTLITSPHRHSPYSISTLNLESDMQHFLSSSRLMHVATIFPLPPPPHHLTKKSASDFVLRVKLIETELKTGVRRLKVCRLKISGFRANDITCNEVEGHISVSWFRSGDRSNHRLH